MSWTDALKSAVSKTGWERSFFGGDSKIIKDYPFIKVSDNVQITPGKESKLGYFEANKLLKMNLYFCNKHGSLDADTGLFSGCTSEKIKKMALNPETMETEEQEFLRVSSTPEAAENMVKMIAKLEPELSALFTNNIDFIKDSKYSVDIPLNKDEQQGEGDGEGEQGENGEGDEESKGKPLSKEQKDKLEELLKEAGDETKKVELKPSSDVVSKDGVRDVEIIFKNVKKGKTQRIGGTEKSNGETLLKMLDISWETDKDILKSLRMGKIDLAKIAEVPAGNVSIYQREEEDMKTRPFSVCILMDESGSMCGGSRIPTQSSIVKSMYHAFSQILPPDKIFIYGHTGDYTCDLYCYHSPHHIAFEETIGNQSRRDFCQNYDSFAISEVHKRVREMTKDRVIFISLSDGQPAGDDYGGPTAERHLKKVIESCRRDDFVTVGVGIQSDHVKKLYNYAINVRNLSKMPQAVSRLLNEVVKKEFQ